MSRFDLEDIVPVTLVRATLGQRDGAERRREQAARKV